MRPSGSSEPRCRKSVIAWPWSASILGRRPSRRPGCPMLGAVIEPEVSLTRLGDQVFGGRALHPVDHGGKFRQGRWEAMSRMI